MAERRVWGRRWVGLFEAIDARDMEELGRWLGRLESARDAGIVGRALGRDVPRDRLGRSPLMRAAERGWWLGVRALLPVSGWQGRDLGGRKELMCAAMAPSQDQEALAALALLAHERPWQVLAADDQGMTPLMRAAQAGWAGAVELLLHRGGAGTLRTGPRGCKEDALMWACASGHVECVKLLAGPFVELARGASGAMARLRLKKALEVAAAVSAPCLAALLEAGAAEVGDELEAKTASDKGAAPWLAGPKGDKSEGRQAGSLAVGGRWGAGKAARGGGLAVVLMSVGRWRGGVLGAAAREGAQAQMQEPEPWGWELDERLGAQAQKERAEASALAERAKLARERAAAWAGRAPKALPRIEVA